MDNTPKYIYNNDLDKKYVNVKIVKNTEYYIFIQLLKKIKKAMLPTPPKLRAKPLNLKPL